jgi:hypothetical protein
VLRPIRPIARDLPLGTIGKGVSAGVKAMISTRRLVLAAAFFRRNTSGQGQGQCVNFKLHLGIGWSSVERLLLIRFATAVPYHARPA